MRYAVEHKQTTRNRILEVGSALVRRTGIAGATVERVMKAAGLTVGGFYAHFASKDALTAELVTWAFQSGLRRWLDGLEAPRGEALLVAITRRYLSRAHRDEGERGCPVPATLSEMPRAAPPVRRAFTTGVEELVEAFGARAEEGDPARRRARALGLVALCFGGLALARAVDDPALSDEILRASRALAADALAAPPGQS